MELYTMIENFGNSGKTFCTRESKIRAGLDFPGDTPRPMAIMVFPIAICSQCNASHTKNIFFL